MGTSNAGKVTGSLWRRCSEPQTTENESGPIRFEREMCTPTCINKSKVYLYLFLTHVCQPTYHFLFCFALFFLFLFFVLFFVFLKKKSFEDITLFVAYDANIIYSNFSRNKPLQFHFSSKLNVVANLTPLDLWMSFLQKCLCTSYTKLHNFVILLISYE